MMKIYVNRELSWLKFNERVLEEAESERVPLCERLNFISIYQSNLDEFFMVRVGSLTDQMIVSPNSKDNKTKMTADKQIEAILKDVKCLNTRKDSVYVELMNQLEKYGIRLLNFQKLKESERRRLEWYFNPESVFSCQSPLDLSFIPQLQDALRQQTDLFFKKVFPQRSSQFRSGVSVFEQIREKDKLLSYPFESMKPFLDFLQEAATDPAVVSIKITLYRMARQSKIIESLIEAAENGKNVQVLVELKARFDEENNIEWSRRLEDSGCQVIYGLEGYKVHSKLCLVTRCCKDGKAEYFTQVGTGNYNEKTARLYTDLSLMTANQDIGLEAATIFQMLFKGETVKASKYLLVAPNCLQNRILDMIDREIDFASQGNPAYIGIKVNSLTDKVIIDRLIEASKAGVSIDLIVRGICCLLPGVPDFTENIRVISIVGRFLEHSRIYIFGAQRRQNIYIASADLMTRNTLRRVEVAVPVMDEDIKQRLMEMFNIMLNDNQQARQLLPTEEYVRVSNQEPPLNSQEFFYQQAYEQPSEQVQELTVSSGKNSHHSLLNWFKSVTRKK